MNNTYFNNGKVKKREFNKNLDLKKSLEILSKNPYSINKGILAKQIVKDLIILFLDDLLRWKTIKRAIV